MYHKELHMLLALISVCIEALEKLCLIGPRRRCLEENTCGPQLKICLILILISVMFSPCVWSPGRLALENCSDRHRTGGLQNISLASARPHTGGLQIKLNIVYDVSYYGAIKLR